MRGAGPPQASGPCRGREQRKACGGCPGEKEQPPAVPAPAPPGAAPALQGRAQIGHGWGPHGGWPPTCRLPPPRGSVQGCWRRPRWSWESTPGRWLELEVEELFVEDLVGLELATALASSSPTVWDCSSLWATSLHRCTMTFCGPEELQPPPSLHPLGGRPYIGGTPDELGETFPLQTPVDCA